MRTRATSKHQGRRAGGTAALAAVGLLVALLPGAALGGTSSEANMPDNLLANPGADVEGAGTPGWEGTTGYKETAYGAPGEYLSESQAHGEAGAGYFEGGSRFFDSGTESSATLTQTVDVSSLSETIDTGNEGLVFGGHLGAAGNSPTTVNMQVTPLDGNGAALSAAEVLDGPTAAERADQTKLVGVTDQRIGSGLPRLPVGTRSLRVQLVANGSHGFADELYMYLRPTETGDTLQLVQSMPAGHPPRISFSGKIATRSVHGRPMLATGLTVRCPSRAKACRVSLSADASYKPSPVLHARTTPLVRAPLAVQAGAVTVLCVPLTSVSQRVLSSHARVTVRERVVVKQGDRSVGLVKSALIVVESSGGVTPVA